MVNSDPKERFSGKVSYYARYRPSYPESFFAFLAEELGLSPDHVIADIGSGTGLSSKWFLRNGNWVYAVEPNHEMQLVAKNQYGNYPNFAAIDGKAEDTNLPDNSVDFIIVGQAFHWFDQAKTRIEFQRILKPNGYVLIVWNERLTQSSVFLQRFENLLLRYSSEYKEVDHRNVSEEMLQNFFGEKSFSYREFLNCQLFNWDGLKGRLFSTSFIPKEDQPEFAAMMEELSKIFRQHSNYGQVKFDYLTRVYYGTF